MSFKEYIDDRLNESYEYVIQDVKTFKSFKRDVDNMFAKVSKGETITGRDWADLETAMKTIKKSTKMV